MAWTDDPLTTVTKYKAVHINELRDSVDNLDNVLCPLHNGSYEISHYNGVQNSNYAVNNNNEFASHYQVNDNSEDGAVQNTVLASDNHLKEASHDNGYNYGAASNNYSNDFGSFLWYQHSLYDTDRDVFILSAHQNSDNTNYNTSVYSPNNAYV